jgi:hypothetical protein
MLAALKQVEAGAADLLGPAQADLHALLTRLLPAPDDADAARH